MIEHTAKIYYLVLESIGADQLLKENKTGYLVFRGGGGSFRTYLPINSSLEGVMLSSVSCVLGVRAR
jgi:hypothetical protein